jgi:hypothetical protein
MSDDKDRWDLYADALIECEIDGHLRCLRGPNSDALPLGGPIFVLTAYNPGGVPCDHARNEVAEARLEHELVAIGLTVWPALGRSRDGSWSEPGVAVPNLGRDRVCEYGTRYGQIAVFELTDDDVHVVRCQDAQTVRTRPRNT